MDIDQRLEFMEADKDLTILAQIAQNLERMNQEGKYSPELILRYREHERAGGFRREIIGHSPVTLSRDRLQLACGHEQRGQYTFLEGLAAAKKESGPPSAHCDKCAEEWLKQEQANETASDRPPEG